MNRVPGTRYNRYNRYHNSSRREIYRVKSTRYNRYNRYIWFSFNSTRGSNYRGTSLLESAIDANHVEGFFAKGYANGDDPTVAYKAPVGRLLRFPGLLGTLGLVLISGWVDTAEAQLHGAVGGAQITHDALTDV